MSVLRFEDVSFEYAGSNGELPVKALDHVTFSVEKGEFIGLIGHTGSGKSTMIQHMNGLLRPTSGRVLLMDKDLADGSWTRQQICAHIGLVFQYPEYQLFEETVARDVAFGPNNLGLSEEETDARVKEALRLVGLDYDELKNVSPFELSGGQKRRVAIAGVIAMKPEILILDEPTVGLDPKQIIEVRDLIKNLSKNHTILLSSHILQEVQAVCDRLIIINHGRIVAVDTPENLSKNVLQINKLEMRIRGPKNEILTGLEAIDGVESAELIRVREEGSVDVRLEAGENVDVREAVFDFCSTNNYPILMMKTNEINLEDIFLQVTGEREAKR